MTGILNTLIAGVSGAVKDTYFNLVSLLLPGNGTNGAQNNTFLDSSTNNFTITRNGNTTQGTFSPFSQTGWGNYFDGSGDYLSVANNAALNLGSSNYTIECWFYAPSAPTANDGIFTKGNTTSVGSEAWSLEFTNSSGNIGFGVGAFNSFASYLLSSSTAATLNAWNHIAVVRNGTAHTMYLNGVSVATATASYTVTSAGSLYLGTGWYAPSTRDFIGYISNARLVIGTAVYTGAFTPSTTPLTAITNTQLLTCQSNRFIDNSSNAFAITANGNTSVVAFSPFAPTAAYTTAAVGGSGYFDGTGDYLSVANTGLFGSGDWTVEMWINAPVGQTDKPILECRNPASGTGSTTGFTLTLITSTEIRLYSGSELLKGTVNYINTWTHVAVSKKSGTTRLYLNGTSVASTASLGTMSDTTFLVAAGYYGSTSINAYGQFYMSGLRVLTGTGYDTSTITIPTSPPTAITNTSLLLNFTNAGITDATAKNDLETVGNAQISTSVSKWGGGSIALDGTGDYLLMPSSQLNAFGTGDFTIEMWFYLNNTSAIQALYDSRPASTDGAYSFIYVNAGGTAIIYDVSAATRITGTATVSTSTWHHFAISRYVGSTRMFFNGNQVGSTYTDSTNYLVGTSRPAIGSSGFSLGTYPLNGYIDDLRVTRYARYVEGTGGNVGKMVFNGTNTLALPTAPFPVQ